MPGPRGTTGAAAVLVALQEGELPPFHPAAQMSTFSDLFAASQFPAVEEFALQSHASALGMRWGISHNKK